jgi:hypothetical protein
MVFLREGIVANPVCGKPPGKLGSRLSGLADQGIWGSLIFADIQLTALPIRGAALPVTTIRYINTQTPKHLNTQTLNWRLS